MTDVLPPPAALRPLDYRPLFDKISSDNLNFESVFSVKEKSVAVVEFRHNLTTSRQGIFDPLAHNGNVQFVMERYVFDAWPVRMLSRSMSTARK